MKLKTTTIFLLFFVSWLSTEAYGARLPHTFALSQQNFLLDGKPFQIISGEMHFARIPREYWRQRIQMAKAMGCNTIATYVFWNYHERTDGSFDFTTWNRNLAEFAKIVQQEGMWLILRPGPYVCGEWDFGGLPSSLLKIPDIKLRCMDSRYMEAVDRYVRALARVVRPLTIKMGGPVILLQIENEYGSYGNDKNYLLALRKMWQSQGIQVPFYTSDGPAAYMLEAGTLPGCAVGLDSGRDKGSFDVAEANTSGVPIFSGETYPGWLTHWGEKWAKTGEQDILSQVKFLMDNKKSFNLYVIHGGTNFGFTAGANSGGNGYEPDVTSYDYDAPIDEQGRPTPKYYALRKLLQSYSKAAFPPLPPPIDTITLPVIRMRYYASLWNHLPHPVFAVQPTCFEANNQNQGLILYRTTLIGHKSGSLQVTQLRDYATVFLDGQYIGTLDRTKGVSSLEIPPTKGKNPRLDILVEGMGHINFAQELIDRKGITERVTLNGMTLMNWQLYQFPLDEKFVQTLKEDSCESHRPGLFFKGSFILSRTGDAYFNLSGYQKGVVWVNGHNLGRYWNIGPQTRLYCPASWLRTGENEIVLFDQHQIEAVNITN